MAGIAAQFHDQRLDGYAIYDRAADTWALSADPCHDDGASLTVAAAGGHWVLRKRQVEDTQILVLRPLSLSE